MTARFNTKWVFLAMAVPAFSFATAIYSTRAGEPNLCSGNNSDVTCTPYPLDRVNLRLGFDSLPYRVEAKEFSRIVIASPSVVDVVALTDRSFYLRPLRAGMTNVLFYDSANIPIKAVEDDIQVINRPQFGSQQYRCRSTGCTFMDKTKYEKAAEVHKEIQ
jgi:hypothetical protein